MKTKNQTEKPKAQVAKDEPDSTTKEPEPPAEVLHNLKRQTFLHLVSFSDKLSFGDFREASK